MIHRVYGGQDGNINYDNVLATMALEDDQVEIPDQDLPPNTIWHFIRRLVSDCGLESDDSPVCIVRIDADGDMIPLTPNRPFDLTLELLAGGIVRLRWRYTRIAEEVSPTGFRIYVDSGGGFDFDTPSGTVSYGFGGTGEFSWSSSALEDGQQYRFCVRSYKEGGGETINTDSVSVVIDSTGPDAITNLITSCEEI